MEATAETEVITATFGANIGNAIDGNLATLFSGTAGKQDSIVYRFTEGVHYRSISILQDPCAISNAVVSVLKNEGYVAIGKLDESAKKFLQDSNEEIYGLKLTFEEETDISIYEIYLDADKSGLDDVGEYVEPIIIETREDITQPTNLALGKSVTVSGTSDGNKDNVNDGDTGTKWDSDFIKGGNARDNSWIYIDLGADKTSIFDEMTMHYYNKIYPTLMYIQVSNDAVNWHDISELTRAHNGTTYPVVTENYDTAYAARYIRLFFEELNSGAAGNGVGLTEWEITGIALSGVSLNSVAPLADIHKALGESLTAEELPKFVEVVLNQKTAGDLTVLAPVSWDISNYDADQYGVQEIVGTLDLPATVDASDRTVTVNVIHPEPAHTHSYEAVVTAPTCTEGGYTTYTCECGDTYVGDEVSALGHDWKGTSCTRCDAKRNNPFSDVPEGSFFIDPVLWAVEKGITTGATATTFNPNGECQRAAVVTFLWRAAGSPEPANMDNPFTDVKETDFFYKAVLWAVEKGVTNGISATQFGPMVLCNRAQVVTFLYRAMGNPEVTSTVNPFKDVNAADWYGPAVLWAVENGITNGMSATEFGVNTICNRAQVVTFLYRTLA